MQRYPEYKDSGIEWIGEIPKDWAYSKLRYHLSESSGGIWGEDDDFGTGTYVLRSTEITLDGSWNLQDLVKRELGDEDTEKFLVQRGDLIVTKSSGSQDHIGKTGLVGKEIESMNACYSNFVQRIRPNDRLNSKFLHYFMNCPIAREQYKYQSETTTGLANLSKQSIGNLLTSIPFAQEQAQIANFLDRKTQHIDELIRAKERKIKLLQEYRASLIQQAVTKGLDANVEMKQSGLEWIGKIPKHWKVRKLKYIAKIVPSYVDKLIYPDEIPVSLCNYTDVYYNDYITIDTILAKGSCNQSEYSRSFLRKEDIIITSDSETPDDIGVPAYVKDNLDNVVCGYHLAIIKSITCLGEFVFRFIQSNSTKEYFGLNSNGITRYSLKKASIENLLVPLPTESEQFQIAHFLNRKTRQIDELRSNEEQTIKLLKEYRQSLISAVVTGKIDVRNEV